MSLSFQSFNSVNSTSSIANNRLDSLVEAKKEYTKQLKDFLINPIYNGFLQIYKDAKSNMEKSGNIDGRLRKFQDYVSRIPKWSEEELVGECKRIVKLSHCDWLDYLITAVFVTHAKIRSIIKNDTKAYRDVMITVPKLNLFLHNCYIECARKMWKNAYLFDDIQISNSEYQRNIRDIETLINDAIDINIRKSLPVKELLKEYLGDNLNIENLIEDDITGISKLGEENIQNMIKKELEDIKLDFNNTALTNINLEQQTLGAKGSVTTVEQSDKRLDELASSLYKTEQQPTVEQTEQQPTVQLTEQQPTVEQTEQQPTVEQSVEQSTVEQTEQSEQSVEQEVVQVTEQLAENNIMDNIEGLNKLIEETKEIVNKTEEIDIDMLSASEVPKLNKNSDTIKKALTDSQNYSIASSKRQKKYSRFLLRK